VAALSAVQALNGGWPDRRSQGGGR
jgi:hypothetical protein